MTTSNRPSWMVDHFAPADPTDDLRCLDWLIAQLELTDPDSWQTEVVRRTSATGVETNCFFGHVYNIGGGDTPAPDGRNSTGSWLWNWVEERWATTFRVYPINDGRDPSYPQATAKDRMIAFLRALRAGEELSTAESMEADYQYFLAQENESAANSSSAGSA